MPLTEGGAAMGLGSHRLEPSGEVVVKVKLAAIEELAQAPAAKYVVVTASSSGVQHHTLAKGRADPRR
jgi:formate--tetrahydrofolate ligase